MDLDLLASKCALSKYHFHRIFKALVGEKPLKYVDKRRLARAGIELLKTDQRIVDIAFEFGFRSHEAFIRAFKKRYLLTPSQFRKIRPKIQFDDKLEIGSLDLKLTHGEAKPNPTILHKSAFSIAGLEYKGSDTNMIDRLWKKFWELYGSAIISEKSKQYLGVCFHDIDMRNNEVFTYYAGFKVCHPFDVPNRMQKIDIPENHYAKFTHKGPIDRIQRTYNQIYSNWLPHSESTPTMDLDIIVIDSRFAGRELKSEVDILIPVSA